MISIERTGRSFHFWFGPIGIHFWRHKSPTGVNRHPDYLCLGPHVWIEFSRKES